MIKNNMKIVLEREAYVRFDKLAKAQGKTTRDLGTEIISEWLNKPS